MVNDSKAEALEAKGLYRRAATRWMDECLHKVRRPPARAEGFGSLHTAAKETQHRMGIAQPNGEAFRLKTSR